MRVRSLAAFLLVSAAILSAQDVRGTFSGTVTDQSGAAVPKASIVAVETQTGTKTNAVSEDSGAYTIPFLAPGKYDITAEAPGFKLFTRKGLTLDAGARPVINIALELGSVNETVTVTSDTPLVTASNASIGQVITTREVENLPINGRTPLMLDNLAMGAISTFEPGPVRPFDNGAPTSVSLGGAPSGTNETLLDGAPDAGFGNALAYSPPQDAVAEVRVNAFESDAAYGHTGGGTLNQVTKSGTNQFSGSLYEFNQVSALDANSFFNNKSGQPRPGYRFNQYGLTAGGPVFIPKVYNGKNKLFWFFAFEGLKDSDPANSPLETGNPLNYATVPTAAERNGDFSALLNVGPQYRIYDPNTGVVSGSQVARTPFANNIIPTNRLNPVSLRILQYFPQPNIPGLANGQNNYLVNAIDTDNYDNELGRLDFNVSDKDKLFFDARHNYRAQTKNPYFPNISQGNYLYRINQGSALDNVYTINPTLVLDVRANWTRYIEIHANPSDGFDLTSLGFPSYMNSVYSQFPVINFSSCSVSAGSEASFQCLGYNGDGSNTYDVYQLYSSLLKVTGNHSFRTGIDIRDYRWSASNRGNSAGAFTFGTGSNSNWTVGPLSNSAPAPNGFGQDFAEFLLGLPTSASIDNNTQSTVGQQYYALFLTDDWRVKSNLTLNLGLRWEHETPITERYNRAVNGFNPRTVNPASAGAAAYAASYAAGAYTKTFIQPPTPSQFNTLGALTFASSSNRYVYNTKSYMFSPRIGVAWTPAALGTGTVIRAGFGIFVSPIEILDNGSSSTVPTLSQQGFSQTTPFVPTNNNYLSPANTLSNPFPTGILPQGSSVGPGAFLGQAISFFNPNVSNPYDIRWNFSIQKQLPGQMVLEVAYIGNHALRLPITTQLD